MKYTHSISCFESTGNKFIGRYFICCLMGIRQKSKNPITQRSLRNGVLVFIVSDHPDLLKVKSASDLFKWTYNREIANNSLKVKFLWMVLHLFNTTSASAIFQQHFHPRIIISHRKKYCRYKLCALTQNAFLWSETPLCKPSVGPRRKQ